MSNFQEAELKFEDEQAEIMSLVLARLCYMINVNVDEDMASESIEEFLNENTLGLHNVYDLAQLVKGTIFNENKDTLH